MATNVILLDDIKGLGTIGEKVSVADGYARNYLLPRDLAAPVTTETLRQVEARKRQIEHQYRERFAAAQALAERIGSESVTIKVEATEEDKLYGSVTDRQIADALAERGVEVDRHVIQLDEPIHELGVYTVNVQLHEEVQTTLKVWVIRA